MLVTLRWILLLTIIVSVRIRNDTMHFPPDTNRPQFSTDPHIVINQVYVFSSFYYLSRGHNMDVHCHIYSPVRQTSAVTHKEFEF